MDALCVIREGWGPEVLLVHGGASPRTTWSALESLQSRWTLALVHRRGYPPSPSSPGAGHDFDVDARDLVPLLNLRPHVVAHSYSVLGTLITASRAPTRVRSLTLIEPPLFYGLTARSSTQTTPPTATANGDRELSCTDARSSPFAYWLLRRLTGYRLYHLIALVFVVMAMLGALAIPFWWLGEQADSVAGFAGIAAVSLAYLYAAMSVLVVATVVVGGLTVRRIRDLVYASKRLRLPG